MIVQTIDNDKRKNDIIKWG